MRRGFTLIEVMVACGILAALTTLMWGSFKGTFKAKAEVEAQAGRYRTVRLALERVARELSMAYLSQNEDTSQAERRTFFVGKHKGSVDELRFSFFGHQRLYQDGNECDSAVIMYYAGRDPGDPRKTVLVRRETRRLQYDKPENAPGEADVLCDDVVGFTLAYYDARDKQWREEWSTTAADGQPDRLPSRVRVTLTVHDERGKEIPFATEARIAMQEPLNLRAIDGPAVPGVAPAGGTPPGGTPAAGGGPAGGARAPTIPIPAGVSTGGTTR